MQIYQGKSVFSGIAIGKIRVYKKNERQVKRVKVENPDAEMARFEEAKAKGIAQLGVLYEKACKEVGEANAAIFEVHQMMMEDDGYNESVENIIKSQGVNAEYAVATTGDNFAQMFSAMDDDYMRERAADVKDISERLISILNGDDTDASLNDEPAIIVADDLAPSETVQMDKDKVLSFVTVHGSLNSHTAILARTMAIPALVGTPLPLDESVDGKLGIVDGSDGTIYVDPDEEILVAMQKRRAEEEEKKKPATKEEEEQQKAKKEKTDRLMMYGTVTFSVVIAVVLFLMVPYFLSELLHKAGAGTTLTAVAEAFARVALFLGYLAAISRMEDIQRVFMYHGAEHKCINCVEHGLELNVENVLKSSREHKRCGTSFLMYVIVISIIFFMFIRVDSPVLKIVIRLLLIPVIAGVSYEIIRLAGKSDNKLVNLISKPGLMLQHLTTREPDAEMAEVAIAAVEAVFDWRAYLNENFGYTYPAKTEKKEHEEP